MERAALICEKMNFKGCFSLTKTATGILFKFSHPEDYQAVFKKGFHKVTGARFYRKGIFQILKNIILLKAKTYFSFSKFQYHVDHKKHLHYLYLMCQKIYQSKMFDIHYIASIRLLKLFVWPFTIQMRIVHLLRVRMFNFKFDFLVNYFIHFPLDM